LDWIIDRNEAMLVLIRDAMPWIGNRTSTPSAQDGAMTFGASPESATVVVFLSPDIWNHHFGSWAVSKVFHLVL
jgi:hypothetical protein